MTISMSTWLLPRLELTPEQLRVVEMPTGEHRVIVGPPGSGKTQILVHRADHIAQTFRVPSDKYRIFVFTNVIKEYIKSAFEFLDLPEDVVSTFDHWCRIMYEANISRRLPRVQGGKGINFSQIRNDVLHLLQDTKKLQKKLDFILVDEGQDLTPQVYEILKLAAHHITVFADPLQKIFEDGASETYILKTLNVPKRNATLLSGYRNSPYVAQLASYFIEDRESRAQYLSQICTEQQVRERPLCFEAPSFDKEMDRLADIISQRQILNERIGIIVPTNRQLHGLTKGLDERGVTVEKAIKPDSLADDEVPCNFGNLMPKIATYHSAKGLTFDSVLMPRLVDKSFPWVEGTSRQRILFVGIARATQWNYLSTVRGNNFAEIDFIRKAETAGHVTIQDTCAFSPRSTSSEDKQSEDGDLSVL